MVLEADHAVTTTLEQELSSTRSELDKSIKAQRAAKAAASRSAAAAAPSQSSTTPFYGYNAPTFSTSASPTFSNFFSSYTYPYGQSFVPGVAYAPTKSTTPSIPGAASFQANVAANGQQTQPSIRPSTTTQSGAGSPTTSVETRPPPVAIPLQLPVTSLPALQTLGILPVPKASLPPPTEPPVFLSFLPLYHSLALNVVSFRIFAVPVTCVLMPKWDATSVLKAIPK